MEGASERLAAATILASLGLWLVVHPDHSFLIPWAIAILFYERLGKSRGA